MDYQYLYIYVFVSIKMFLYQKYQKRDYPKMKYLILNISILLAVSLANLNAEENIEEMINQIALEKESITSDISEKELKIIKLECIINLHSAILAKASGSVTSKLHNTYKTMIVDCLSAYEAADDCENIDVKINCINKLKSNYLENYNNSDEKLIIDRFNEKEDSIVEFIKEPSEMKVEELKNFFSKVKSALSS